MAPRTQEHESSAADGRRNNFITHLSMDEDTDAVKLLHNSNSDHSDDPTSFLRYLLTSSGPPQIIILCLIIALALGSTVGVVPAVVEDRYARLNHGYTGEPCLQLKIGERPNECLLGNDDAQNSAALSSFISNALTFSTCSLMGSISDERGRRGIILLGIGLRLLGPMTLVLMQVYDGMSPFPYYVLHASSGFVNWMALALSSLSDVIPAEWRAPAFGMVMAGFSLGFALSPILAVFMSHFVVSIFAFIILVGGFIFACFYMPETLSPESAAQARLKRLSERPVMNTQADVWKYNLLRPAQELMILNRNKLFRLLSALAFFSGCISNADHTLFLYYVEDNFGFNDSDVAKVFMIIGVMGMFVQTVLLKPFNSLLGERRLIMFSFLVGSLHNYLYGVAESKRTIFVSVTLASLTGMSFPTISAIKSNNVAEMEQGRIQGALYSLQALASAFGPMLLRYVYNETKDGGGFGRGTMFIFGAGLYLVATLFAWALPEEEANSNYKKYHAKKRSSLVTSERQDGLNYGSTDP
jgi:DHA1 family tetracycline resistance protein-like MFS transporter